MGVTQKAFLVYNLLAKGWVPRHLGAKKGLIKITSPWLSERQVSITLYPHLRATQDTVRHSNKRPL